VALGFEFNVFPLFALLRVAVRKLIFLLVIEFRFLASGCAKGAFHGVLVSPGNAGVPRGFRFTTCV